MRFSFVRNILFSFLILIGGYGFACLLVLYALEQVSDQLNRLAVPAEAVRSIFYGEILVVCLVLFSIIAGLCAMLYATHQASRVFNRLKLATQQLANAVLDDDSLALGSGQGDDLEHEIQEMMRKIKVNQQLCLDASPLTRLPGNIAIEQVLKEKMDRGEKFALCYIDLDDFKAYNDKYGYAKGSELIKLTGEIIHAAKDRHAHPHDFIGHIGGDDFVLITSPELAEVVSEAIITEFDRVIPEHYEAEDRARAYIEGPDRYGVIRRFPLMTISIAVVSDAKRNFHSPIEIAQVATEIKDYVKSLPGSNYLIDRRTNARWGE